MSVGKSIVLLFLSAFLYTHGASVLRTKDINETNSFLSSFGDIYREKCSSEVPCQNGGKCENELCECPDGTEGDDCNKVTACETLKCEKKAAKCDYDSSKNPNTFCVCTDPKYKFNEKEDNCVECDCGANGQCSLADGQKTCQCDSGFKERNGKCAECKCGPNAKCSFDGDNTVCTCNKGYKDKGGTCTECKCGPNEKCSFDGDNTVCTCNEGYKDKDGTCTECDCGRQGMCSFDGENKLCICNAGYIDKDGTCTECDCGYRGKCSFVNGVKTCDCDGGFQEKDGKCTACDCGLRGSCHFNSSGDKICDCFTGYAPYKGDCFECDCGLNGKCSRETGLKACICNADYSEKDGKCVYCSCGENSKSCSYNVLNEKECNCSAGYVQNNGYCEECNCGPYGSCSIKYEIKRCNCKSFAVERNGVCVVMESTTLEGTTAVKTTSLSTTAQYCNCGEYSKSCSFNRNDEKICNCFPGFAQKYGSCEECNCGPYGSCSFQNGRKTCHCGPLQIEINGVCVETGSSTEGTTDSISTSTIVSSTVQECDCGPRGRCTLESGRKKCICDAFTSERDGRCVDCYCGENSNSCHFNWKGEKICNCTSGYSQYFGFCYECNCGLNAKFCFYRKNGTKVCNCDFEFTQIDGYCTAICSEDKCVHGKCEIMGNGFKCRCIEGFTGQRCEDKIQAKPNKPDVWRIILLIIAFAIFILLFVVVCFLGRMKNKMSKK